MKVNKDYNDMESVNVHVHVATYIHVNVTYRHGLKCPQVPEGGRRNNIGIFVARGALQLIYTHHSSTSATLRCM